MVRFKYLGVFLIYTQNAVRICPAVQSMIYDHSAKLEYNKIWITCCLNEQVFSKPIKSPTYSSKAEVMLHILWKALRKDTN